MQLDLLFQIAGVGILTTVVASVLNSSGRSELANLATVAGLAIVLLMVVSLLSQLFTNVRTALVRGIASLSAMSGLDDSFMQQLLKIAGLSLLLDFAAQTCRDAQEEALALKVEFAGRVLLLSSALPVLQALLSQLVSLPLS